MNYAIGYALNGNDLMTNFPIQKLKIKQKDLDGKKRRDLAAQVWRSCVDLAIQDVIDNSDTFELPTVRRDAEIYIKGTSGEDFIKGRQNGKWQDVDYLNTNFTGYQMMLKFQRAGYKIEKPIYLDPIRKQQIADRANSGKSYY